MQPRHCAPEIAGPGKDWAENVGPGRWHKAWSMRSLREAGAVLALSSDWNVAEMDPMAGIYTAVTRRPLTGGTAWQPAETLDVATAVHGYTMGSAYANFPENERGSLSVGKLATSSCCPGTSCAYDPRRSRGPGRRWSWWAARRSSAEGAESSGRQRP
ncbi:amidohydrolase family protein [Streptomyces sp. NPDC018059]|uniref:amidohydrolase family protein n=1 Tax=Streptomyces sp. NPDC018059 TaxID=3365041 RepID=UPI0037920163